ncbi:permease [Bacillus clarus]|uniref:Permease n=1 Tax=Bacillus clarus TaxID=2338372 RepID=A0A090Z3B1_9BACI|nr:hypothetical protein [Bacillus clarus]KFM98900.1 hypothetical protein DJ93_4470 [Bacillus clarus]RFT67067.1 permease [Bacillus clarus]
MKSSFICHTCQKKIVRKQDLITATLYLRIYSFHQNCFKQQLFVSRFVPVNTLFGLYLVLYTFIIGSILVVTEPSIIWLVFLIPILYRLISYYYIERHFCK